MRKSDLPRIPGFTKNEVLSFIRMKLQTDINWASKACKRIFDNQQTKTEKNKRISTSKNGIGFNKIEAPLLSSIAVRLNQNRKLTESEKETLLIRMEKYCKQIYYLSDSDLLLEELNKYYKRKFESSFLF